MRYFLTDKETGRKIEAKPERWVWGIVYKDGTEISQFGGDGTFHRVGEVDQDRIAMAVLHRFDDFSRRVDIPWRAGMRLIHKYRNIVLEAGTEAERQARVYMFGYKDGAHHSVLFVLPDDRIVFSNDPEADVTAHGI